MDEKIINLGLLYDEQIINIINEFSTKLDNKIEFKEIELKLLKYILNNKNLLNNINIKKGIKRKIHTILFNSKKKTLQIKKRISLNNNKLFHLIIYIYIFIINKIQNELNYINDETDLKYELIFKNIFLLAINLVKNNFLSFHSLFSFQKFYLKLFKNDEISLQNNVKNLIIFLSFVKKTIKIANNYKFKDSNEKEITKKLINDNFRYIIEKIFKKINKNSIYNFIFKLNLLKYPKILDLLKFCYDYYDINIISNENINYIKKNLIKLMMNNLNFDHLNYLYDLSKKYLLN